MYEVRAKMKELARFYFRRAGIEKVRLTGLPWSTEFMDSYEAALNQAVPVVIGQSAPNPARSMRLLPDISAQRPSQTN